MKTTLNVIACVEFDNELAQPGEVCVIRATLIHHADCDDCPAHITLEVMTATLDLYECGDACTGPQCGTRQSDWKHEFTDIPNLHDVYGWNDFQDAMKVVMYHREFVEPTFS